MAQRGRPGQGAQPDQVVYQIEGALASSLAARQALIDQHSCFILATNELDEHPTAAPGAVGQATKARVMRNAGFAF